ncbi:Nicastrin Precursor [Vigna angularis]|uniref:Nicastrin n=1 Tax=Phaseolus angularis TaxID=3914 RepID=A0A8T0L338_PHAAN|nr:Nicastrin Precursor [Vigna angularis]
MALIVLSLFLLLFTFHLPFRSSGQSSSMESVPDLQHTMYASIEGYPCVRLLNLSGNIDPGRDKVVAPIVRFGNVDKIAEPSAVLVSVEDFPTLFTRISDDSRFASKVSGVLVEPSTDLQNKINGFSPDQKFPQGQFAPYHNTGYEWNPIGSGVMWKSYNFPVFLLTESGSKTLQEFVTKNEDKKKAYTSNVAEFDLVMQTVKSGTLDSESCLKEETCLPLGGYSVWSSLPPINTSSSQQSKPILMTVASMDSASFFRDKTLGADSPISGLIALLAAVDALSHLDGLGDLSKQLVFAVFTGEAWGYLGSRRFLVELDLHSDAVHGLNHGLIEKVIEIGSVGKGLSGGVNNFFAHTEGDYRNTPNLLVTNTSSMQDSSATNQTMGALKRAQESLLYENIKIASASSSNPGIPPSSLMSFLEKNPAISGVVLEDFDSVFVNKFYHSHLDDLSNVNSSAVVAAASLVARTLYILASKNEDVHDSTLSAINVNVSLVEQLMGCLLDCNPGLSCELVKKYISPMSTCPSHYVGVILDEPSSTPYTGYINDVPRFIWNFLADRTSIPRETNSSGCQHGCNDRDEVCIKAETDGKGVCVLSTTRYVPAYSTRLKFESGVWNVLPPNSSEKMGVVDPVWTESNWNSIGMRVYTVQNTAYDRLVLFGGITLTIISYLAIATARTLFSKAMKRD